MFARCTGERKAFTTSDPVDAQVVDVLRAAGDVGDAVVPGDPCADSLHDVPPRLVMLVPAAVTVMSKESPRAAAATASMIFT